MLINEATGKPFTLLELSSVAREYYDSYRSGQIQSGFDKYIATDGYNVMFVSAAYEPENDDIAVFHCDVRRGGNATTGEHVSGTGVSLHKPYPTDEQNQLWHEFARWRDSPAFALKNNREYRHGKITRDRNTEPKPEES